jgi:hypothetical protein
MKASPTSPITIAANDHPATTAADIPRHHTQKHPAKTRSGDRSRHRHRHATPPDGIETRHHAPYGRRPADTNGISADLKSP